MEHSMETIFREAAKALGQIASQKLMNDVFKEEEVTKPKKAVAAKKNEDEPERWSRWTKPHTESFKKSLTAVGLGADEKELDKLKKEFVKYLKDLTEEDYTKDSKTHSDHMNDFANLKAPKKEEQAAKPAESAKTVKVKATATKASAAPKKEEEKKKSMWEEMHDAPNEFPSSNAAAHINDVDLKELQNNDRLITVEGSPAGVYFNGRDGNWVRGPEADDDEHVVEKKYNGETYMVGEKSLRIYRETDNRDEFVGYVGVGRFHDMKI